MVNLAGRSMDRGDCKKGGIRLGNCIAISETLASIADVTMLQYTLANLRKHIALHIVELSRKSE